MKHLSCKAVVAAALVSACGELASPDHATPVEFELGEIKAEVVTGNDRTVIVELGWAVTATSGKLPNAKDLPPVYLFNEHHDLKLKPSSRDLGGRSHRIIRFRAVASVLEDEWREGCWQADYRMVGVVASGPITCVNQVA